MDEPTILDKAFHVIMKRMVETGQAPFYTELASSLGLAVEEGRNAKWGLYDLPLFGGLTPVRKNERGGLYVCPEME